MTTRSRLILTASILSAAPAFADEIQTFGTPSAQPTHTLILEDSDGNGGWSSIGGHSSFLWHDGMSMIFQQQAFGADAEWRWTAWDAWSNSGWDVMSLRTDGTLDIRNPSSAAETIIDGNGQITFRNADGGTGTLQITASGASGASPVLLNGSAILTQTTADARYLRTAASGATTLVFGAGSTASGDHAISLGKATRAIGLGAVAIGATNQENGGILEAAAKGATAIGYGAQSSGEGAVAMGISTGARGKGSVAIGELAWAAPAAAGAVAIGYGSWASGPQSVSIGHSNYAQGPQSVALGWGNYTMSGASQGVALGALNHVSAPGTTALGARGQATAWYATTIGNLNVSSGWGALAVGDSNTASGTVSTAMGATNQASAWGSFAAGTYSRSQGYNASALGVGTHAAGPGQFVVGAFNAPAHDNNGYMKSDNDALFIVGNGFQTKPEGYTGNAFTSSGGYADNPWVTGTGVTTTRQNAFVVRWNGKTEATGTMKAAGYETPGTFASTATTGFHRFKTTVLVPASGDISMGEFTGGEQP